MPIAAVSPVHAIPSRAPAPERAAAELPDAPKPLTPATAAVHIMNVPSSRVLEAFALMQREWGQQARGGVAPAQGRWPAPAPRPLIDLEA